MNTNKLALLKVTKGNLNFGGSIAYNELNLHQEVHLLHRRLGAQQLADDGQEQGPGVQVRRRSEALQQHRLSHQHRDIFLD